MVVATVDCCDVDFVAGCCVASSAFARIASLRDRCGSDELLSWHSVFVRARMGVTAVSRSTMLSSPKLATSRRTLGKASPVLKTYRSGALSTSTEAKCAGRSFRAGARGTKGARMPHLDAIDATCKTITAARLDSLAHSVRNPETNARRAPARAHSSLSLLEAVLLPLVKQIRF